MRETYLPFNTITITTNWFEHGSTMKVKYRLNLKTNHVSITETEFGYDQSKIISSGQEIICKPINEFVPIYEEIIKMISKPKYAYSPKDVSLDIVFRGQAFYLKVESTLSNGENTIFDLGMKIINEFIAMSSDDLKIVHHQQILES